MDYEQPKYLTEKDVCKITAISLATLRNDRFLCRGIPYIKIGRSVRYNLQVVIDYMETRKVNTKLKICTNEMMN